MAKKSDKTWVKNQSLYDSGKAQEERQQKILSGEISWVPRDLGTTVRVWSPATDKPYGGSNNIGVDTSAQDRRRAEREKSDKTWVKNQSLYDSGKAQEERQQKILSGEISWVPRDLGTTVRVWSPATDKPYGGSNNIGVDTSAKDRRRAERENGNYARWKAYNEGYPATPPAGSGLQQLTLDTAGIEAARKQRQQQAAAVTDNMPRANVPKAASVTPETDYTASQRNMLRLGKNNVRHTEQPEVMGDTLGEWFTDPLASLYDQVLTPTGEYIDRNIIDPIAHPKKAKIREQNRAAQNRIAQEVSKEDAGVDLLDMTDKGATDYLTGITGILDMTLGNIASAAGWKDNIFRQWNDLAQTSQAANQAYFDNRLKNAGKVKKFLQGELVPQLVSMLPDLELAMLGFGGSVALEAGATGLAAFRNRMLNAMSSPAWWSAFVREAGTGYNDEIAKGESEADAAQYAILTGWINAMIEMSGGVQDIPAKTAARKGFLTTVLGTAGGEAMEEPAQSIVSQIMENFILQRGNPVFSMEDENAVINPRRAAHEALLAGAAGALMGAPAGVNNAAYKAQNSIAQLRAMAEEAAAQESKAQESKAQESKAQERPAPVTAQATEAPKAQAPAAAPAQEAVSGSGAVINNPGAVTPVTGEETARNAEIQEIAGLIDQIARQRSAQEAQAQQETEVPAAEPAPRTEAEPATPTESRPWTDDGSDPWQRVLDKLRSYDNTAAAPAADTMPETPAGMISQEEADAKARAMMEAIGMPIPSWMQDGTENAAESPVTNDAPQTGNLPGAAETVSAVKPAAVQETAKPATPAQTQTPANVRESNRKAVNAFADSLGDGSQNYKAGATTFKEMYTDDTVNPAEYVNTMQRYYESGRETPGKPFTGKKIAPPLTLPQAQAAYRAGQIDAENQAKTTAKAPETVAKEAGKAYTVNRESESGKAAVEEAKAELKKAIKFPVKTTNEKALLQATTDKALSDDVVTITGRVPGFTPVQQQTLVSEIIKGSNGSKDTIRVSVPMDGTFTIRNTPDDVAKVLAKLKAKVNQEYEISDKLDKILRSANHTAVVKIDGENYVTNGYLLVPVSERTAEFAKGEYKARQLDGLDNKYKELIKADVVRLDKEPVKLIFPGNLPNLYQFTLPDGSVQHYDARCINYLDGAAFYTTHSEGKAQMLRAVQPDGNIAGYVLNNLARNTPVSKELAKLKSYKHGELAVEVPEQTKEANNGLGRERGSSKAAAKNVDTSGANGYDALKNALNSSSRVTTADGLEYTITGLNELTSDMNTGGRSNRTTYRTRIRRTGGDKLGGSISNARDEIYSAGPFDTLEEAREDLLAVAKASGFVGKGATNGLEREQGAAGAVHDGAGVLQSDGIRDGDRGLLDAVASENVPEVRDGARRGQPVPADEEAGQGADAAVDGSAGRRSERGPGGRDHPGAVSVRTGAGDDAGGRGGNVRGGQAVLEGAARDSEGSSSERPVNPVKTSDTPASADEKGTVARADTQTVGNYVIPEGGLKLPNGEKARFNANYEAIRIAKQCELEGRRATAEEQEALSKFVGWGGLAGVFDSGSKWAKEQKKLKALLSEEEYAAASKSTMNAHYTSIEVVRAMYDGLLSHGVKGGNVLEPSAGTGNFIGAMPEALRGGTNAITMVELDPMTARIAALLYPDADVRAMGFEQAIIPNNSLDLVVGNVPFGNYPIADPNYPQHIKSRIHNYFIVRSLDLLKPGGTMCIITSAGTLNASDTVATRVREEIAKRADLVGAIRLPNTAFKGNASTEVVTDILVLRKRAPGTPYRGENFQDTNHAWTEEGRAYYRNNEYFDSHPEMVLGTTAKGTMYGGRDEMTVNPKPGKLTKQIEKAFASIKADLSPTVNAASVQEIQEQNAKRAKGKNAKNVVRNGKIYKQADDGTLVENKDYAGTDAETKAKAAVLGSALELRDTGRSLLELQMNGADEAAIQAERSKLNKLYDAFVKKYGNLNARKNRDIIAEDGDYSFIRALENVEKHTSTVTKMVNGVQKTSKKTTYTYSKADIFSVNTVARAVPVTHVDSAAEAVSVSMNMRARIDLPYIAQLLGKSESEARSELINNNLAFLGGSGELIPARIYLSGNVRAKLRQAEGMAQSDKRYERNVKALREVIPEDVPAEKIAATVGVPWIPLETYAQFINETLEAPNAFYIEYDAERQSFSIQQRGYSRRNVEMGIAGDAPRTFSQLYEQMFSGKPITITSEGKVLKDATRKARARQKEIQAAFTKWLWSDEGRKVTLGKVYNDTYNAYVDTEYDGVGVHPAGLAAGVQLKPHQAKAVQRALQGGGNVLLAHATGAGKTLEIASIIMEGRRLGIFSKPMVVVPKNVLAQWPLEFRKFFPNAKILAADDSNFKPANRNNFLAQAMNGDWDAIIMSYTQFEKLPISALRHKAYIEQEIAQRRAQLERARNSRGRGYSVKNIEKNLAKLEVKLKELDAKAKREQALETFDGLGIDGLFVDEFHNFKNLGFYSKLDRVVGLSKSEAAKTDDMLEKFRYLQAHNGGRGVVVATATPLTNAINEVYTMQRYLQPDLLNSLNMMDFDNWAKQFCVLETIDTTGADGSTRKQKTAMTAYQNVPELSSMFRQCADVERHPPVGKLPTVRGGKYTVVELEPTEFQAWYMSKLPALLQEGEKSKDSKINPLTVQGLGRNVSVSRMLVDKSRGVEEGEKLTYVCSETVKEYHRTSGIKGTQLIFLDKGVPGGKYDGALYNWITDRLVEEGIPREEIANIYEWESKKDELAEKVNDGEIRVVLGSYMKLGVGINVQKRLSMIHLADIPYRPADLEQAVGRGIRQGNMNEDVGIMAYVTKNTFDTKSWDTVLRKARINGQIMDGTYKGRGVDASTDDITNFAELTAIASGDTRMTKQLALSNDVESLRSLQQDWEIRVNRAKEEIGTTEADIARTTRAISAAKADAGRVQDMSGDKFRITIDGKSYGSRKDAGETILTKRDAILKKPSGTMEKIGTFSGFDLYLTWASENPSIANGGLILRGQQDYPSRVSDSGVGTMNALGNTLAAIEKDIPNAERYLGSLKDKLTALKETAQSKFERSGELKKLESELDALNADLEENPPKLVKDDPELDAKFGDRITYIADVEDEDEGDAGGSDVQASLDYNEESAPVKQGISSAVQYSRETQNAATRPHPEEWTTTRVGEDKTPKRLSEIIEQIHHEFRVNITTGKIRGKGVRGQHSTTSRGIRTRLNNNLPTIAHELGHHLDLQYEITDGLPADMKKELVNGLPAEFAEQYPEDALPGEGMAEFIRRYLQNSAETAAAYPKFTEHFMNAMSDQDRARFVTLADEVNAYMGTDPGVSGNIRPMEEGRPDFRTPMEKLKASGSALYQAWVDAQHGVKRFSDSIGNNRAYIKATNAAYADARASQTVTGDLYDVDGKWIGPGLAKSLQGLDLSDKKTVALFNEYLVVKHAPERTNDDGEMLDVFADSRYNNPAWLKTRQGQIERQHPEFAEISERLYEFERKFLQTWAVDTGLIPETVAKTWANRWQYYVPFYRVIEKGGPAGAKRAFSNQDAGIRKARGSGRDIIEPLDGIVSQIVRIVNAGVRNDVMRTITDYAEGMGADAAFLEKVPTPLKVTTVDLSDTKALLQEMLGESDLDADAVIQAQRIVGSLDDILKQYGRGKAGGNVVYVMKNGKPEFWKINDPGLLDSITNLSTPKLKGILDAYAQVSRFMTGNITGRNVIWSLFSNFPRDLQTLFTYAPTKNPLKLFRGIGSAYLNKAKGTNADPLFLQYLAMGGGEASYYTADRDMAKKARSALAKAQKRFNLSANPLDWLGFISDTIECGPRYSVFKYLRQSGVDAHDAFYAAMDVTVNFRRGGRLSRDMNKVVPFFNAGVQGLDKFARWITAQDAEPGKPRSRTARSRAIGWVAVSAVLAAAFYALNNRDKEHEEDYQQLSNYTKNNFWCIPIGDGKYFAIPKPRELAVLSSLLETTMERTAGGNTHAFDEFYEYFTEQCLPNMLNDLAKGDIYGTIGQLGIVGVGSYMMANRDFLGRPIESNGMKYYEPKDRYNERTSKIAYWLGQAFGVSPVMLDYFFQQTLGGFWKTQKALFPIGKSAVDPTLGVLNTYVKDNQYSQDLTNWMYDKAEASAQAAKSNPNDGNLNVTAKMDARMTEFYGRYYKLAKTERETTQTRGTRQTVLTMIQEWREASDTGYLTPVQKAVYDIAADYGTDYLPGTMQTYVKDENKEKHPLSAAQYVEFQTNYLRIYWEIAEEKLPYASDAEEQAEVLKEAKKTALAEASEAALKQAGF